MQINSMMILSAVLLASVIAFSLDKKMSHEEKFVETVPEFDCMARDQNPNSSIKMIIVDQKKFCSLSNFLFYGEESRSDIAFARNLPSSTYANAVSQLLDVDGPPEQDQRFKEVLGVVVAFYRSPYQSLTIVVEDGDSTLKRTINK